MTSVTIELPDTLSQAIQQRHIPRQRLEGAVVGFLELYLHELDREAATPGSQPWSDGTDFARHIIGNNRELFKALAKL